MPAHLNASELAALVTTHANAPAARAMADSDMFATVYSSDADNARPVFTLSRPRLIGSDSLFWVADTTGRQIAAFSSSPTIAAVRKAVARFQNAGNGLADMTAAELAAELETANASARENRDDSENHAFAVFKASALCRAIRAERRAELAAELAAERAAELDSICPAELAAVATRVATPALVAAVQRAVARVVSGVATGRDFAAVRVLSAILATRQNIGLAPAPQNATAAELAAIAARRAALDSAFALNVRPVAAPFIRARAFAVESFA